MLEGITRQPEAAEKLLSAYSEARDRIDALVTTAPTDLAEARGVLAAALIEVTLRSGDPVLEVVLTVLSDVVEADIAALGQS